MASLWREFVDFVDSQISVEDHRFWSTDLRSLAAWALLPFVTLLFLVDRPSTLAELAGLAGFLLEAGWIWFVFKRRAIKKRHWTEPTRYSDQNEGY